MAEILEAELKNVGLQALVFHPELVLANLDKFSQILNRAREFRIHFENWRPLPKSTNIQKTNCTEYGAEEMNPK